MTAETMQLRVDGRVVEGFETGDVVASMDGLASSFTLNYSEDRLAGGGSLVIEAGDPVEVAIAGDVVLSGYVDTDAAELEKGRLKRKLSGRSRLGDLADCTAYVAGRKRWRDASLFDIASDLIEGYGIPIYDRARDVDPFERFDLRDGESIADCLLRAAKARGVVLIDEGGDLALTYAGEQSTQTVIRDTTHIGAKRERSWKQRFGEYLFRTNKRPKNAARALADTSLAEFIEDDGVSRLRRLVVFPYGEKAKDVEKRSILERNVRRGRAETLTYTMPNFRDDQGELWQINSRVRVIDPVLDVDAVMLIIGVGFHHATDRHRTALTMTLPSAYDQVIRVPTRARGETLR